MTNAQTKPLLQKQVSVSDGSTTGSATGSTTSSTPNSANYSHNKIARSIHFYRLYH